MPVHTRKNERMPASCAWRTLGVRVLVAAGALFTGGAMRAQFPPLAPTSDTTIVVSGPLHYSSIVVPVGVTVRFVLPATFPPPFFPAVISCDGDAIVHGTFSISGNIIVGFGLPAGRVTTGQGLSGISCGSGPFGFLLPPQGGRHAGTYGSALPFSLAGGSPGGDLVNYSDTSCTLFARRDTGGEGGGTLVLLAGGRIEVDGTVTADGYGGAAGGSGGSILLRGAAGVSVLPTGFVTSRGWPTQYPPGSWSPQVAYGAPGYVRLDAWGSPPSIQGTVDPPPTALELPHLRTQISPRIGMSWQCEVFAPENAAVFVAVSGTQGTGTPTPFGPLGIDGPSATILAYAAITPPGHDPFVSVSTPVPNVPALVGLTFWVQALAAPPALPARLSNTISVVVQ